MPDLFDTKSDTRPLTKRLEDFGCHYVIELRTDDTSHAYARAEYLDLIPGKKGDRSTALPVQAVVEHQNAALLYVTFEDQPAEIEKLQKELANRSDAAWLGILRPGELEVRPITFKPKPQELLKKHATDDDAALFFQCLVHGQVGQKAGKPKAMGYVAKLIFDQLMFTAKKFVPEGGTTDPTKLTALEILSMCGRALFFRFLMDRKIVVPEDLADICEKAKDLKDVFSSPEKAALTSAWLDATFNGDFLRLFSEQQDQDIPTDDKSARAAAYRRYYKGVNDKVGAVFFQHLRAIVKGLPVPVTDEDYEDELELDWRDLNFAHIPVGVLSQVYESYSHWVEGEEAKQASVHYTPLPIARMMVDQCFGPGVVKNPAHARVLDPSCGAGIFLVLAFRRLIEKRWEHDEVQPDTKLIRQMLRQQLTGFDISESALRLAALSLYITAIEMDPEPRPVKKLKFDDLRGSVLHNFRDPAQKEGFQIGSLGGNVPKEFDGAFDLVIGNPPWTRLKEKKRKRSEEGIAHKKAGGTFLSDEHNKRFTEIGVDAINARELPLIAATYTNPDNNPDLPFFWRATMWAKQDALIALALPARLILHASNRGAEGWHALLQAVSLTGVINGAELRWSKSVWTVKVPFCMVFARNAKPSAEHCFMYAVPLHDKLLNRSGRYRIDYQTLQSLGSDRVKTVPWLLKTLQVGTWRDAEIIEGIAKRFPQTLASAWLVWDPKCDKTGLGYNRSPDSDQTEVDWLGKLKVFDAPDDGTFGIKHDKLITYQETWGNSKAHRVRTLELYQPPLVIVAESPEATRRTPRGFKSDKTLTFSVSYYGYSCKGHPEAEVLAALIYLLPHSLFFDYFLLMTSARFGADRQTFKKEEFDAIPFPDVTILPKETKATIKRLALELEHNPAATKPWEQIDEFFVNLYQIEPRDAQVMRDTLFSAAPYRTVGKAAFEPVTFDEDKDYCTRTKFAGHLESLLQPFFGISGYKVAANVKPKGLEQRPQFDVWGFIAIHRDDQPAQLDADLLSKVTLEADGHGASRVIIRLPGQRGLLLGLLNEQRWWTQTRASFCAQRIVRDYLDAFDLHE
jgi:hypothetical protein